VSQRDIHTNMQTQRQRNTEGDVQMLTLRETTSQRQTEKYRWKDRDAKRHAHRKIDKQKTTKQDKQIYIQK